MKDIVAGGTMKLKNNYSLNNVAEAFTKPLEKTLFDKLGELLGIKEIGTDEPEEC